MPRSSQPRQRALSRRCRPACRHQRRSRPCHRLLPPRSHHQPPLRPSRRWQPPRDWMTVIANDVNDTMTRVSGIRVGHTTDAENATGCTVVLLPDAGVRCVVDVRGGAPGTRETPLLSEGVAEPIYAITLSG